RDARVRAREAVVRPADRGHPDEVVRARPEGREGRRERAPAEHLHADRGRDELLLRDVHLEEALGVLLAEDVGVGRVRDLAVTPLPLIVRATTTVGTPVVSDASA